VRRIERRFPSHRDAARRNLPSGIAQHLAASRVRICSAAPERCLRSGLPDSWRDFLCHPQSSANSQSTQPLYKRAVQKQIQVLLALMNSLGLLEEFLTTIAVGSSNSAGNLADFSPALPRAHRKTTGPCTIRRFWWWTTSLKFAGFFDQHFSVPAMTSSRRRTARKVSNGLYESILILFSWISTCRT
jgi:hypothetical protein